MKKIILMLSIVAGVSMFYSCNDDSSTGSGDYTYKVRMTDAPGPFDSVNIDLQAVEVTGNNGQTVMLNTTEGMYNLLDYSNTSGGFKLAELIVSNGLCSDTVQNIFALKQKLAVDFIVPLTSCPEAPVIFKDNSSNAVNWLWNFSNGNTSNLQNPPPQQYPNTGIEIGRASCRERVCLAV